MDKNKLILPIVILLSCIVLGGFYYASQVGKQKSIEKQLQNELEQKKQEEKEARLEKTKIKVDLENCLAKADVAFKEKWNKHCTSLKLEENCKLSADVAKTYNQFNEEDKNTCFKKYPQQ